MTPKLSAIAETIRRRMYELDIRTIRALETKADVPADSIRHLLSGRTKTIRAEKLESVAKALNMTVDALVNASSSGTGEPLAVTELPDAYMLVPRYDVHLSAGAGAFPAEDAEALDHIPFRRDWLKSVVSGGTGKLAMVRASGESMEPAIRSGDDLLIDLDDTKVADGSVYALLMNDALVVKRVFSAPGGLEIRSDNPNHPSWQVSGRDESGLRIIGRVAVRIGKLA